MNQYLKHLRAYDRMNSITLNFEEVRKMFEAGEFLSVEDLFGVLDSMTEERREKYEGSESCT